MVAKIRERLTHFRVGDSLDKVSIIGRAKRAPFRGVQSIFRVIYMYIYIISRYVCHMPNCGMTWPRYIHAQSQLWTIETCDTRVIHLEQL